MLRHSKFILSFCIQGKPSTRPDGDIELYGLEKGFVVPDCDHCGGLLKPDVVFFGDSVPQARAERFVFDDPLSVLLCLLLCVLITPMQVDQL